MDVCVLPYFTALKSPLAEKANLYKMRAAGGTAAIEI